MKYKERQRIEMERAGLVQTDDTTMLLNEKFRKYSGKSLNYFVEKIKIESGITDLTTTALINTFGAKLLGMGFDYPQIAHLMGDRTVAMTKSRYEALSEVWM